MRKLTTLLLAVLVLVGGESCSNQLDVDISNSTYQLRTKRLDNLVNQSSSAQLIDSIAVEFKENPDLIEYLFYYCYKIGLPTDTVFERNWKEFVSNPYYQRLTKEVKKSFPDLSARNQRMLEGFQRLQVHLPQAQLPKSIVYVNSYFASSVYCTENEISIGLERYLGHQSPVIQELPGDMFYDWIKRAMNPDYLERDALCGWIMTHICEPAAEKNAIESFIQWGKILYLTRAAFPDIDERIILRYSKEQFQWAIANERNTWEHLVKQNILFSTNETTIATYLQEGPFTSGLNQKSPDRMGQFIGYRIICSYMEQYNVTLQELLEKPYNEILSEYEIND